MIISLFIAVTTSWTVISAANCDKSNAPTTNPYYKSFCGRTFVVGFSQDFAPYSWKVDAADEETETLLYVDSISEYATMDGWIGLDADVMDEIAEFLGFNYTVVDVRLPGT